MNISQTKKLGELCEIRPSKSEARIKLKDKDLVSFVPMEDLGIFTKSFEPKHERELKDVYGSYTYFADGDVLLAKITPCFENGKIGIAHNLKNGIGFGSSEFIVFRSRGQILPDYLYYVLSSDNFRNQGIKLMSGAVGHKRVPKEYVDDYEVFLPSLTEQKRAVRIIDEAFEKLQEVKKDTENNIQNSLDLFESYSRVAFDNPGNWTDKTLGEVCNLYQGIAINAKTRHALVEKSDLPLLRIKDLKHNTVEQYIDPNNFPKNALVNERDLIYTRTGQIGLVFTGKRGVLHNNSFKIVPNNTLSREYLFYWLQNPTFKSKIVSLASRAAQPDITHTLFKQQPISIPSLPEQKSIVKKLDQLSNQTKKLESIYQKKLSAIEELKESILSKAFSKGL
jgi:type I restriction enzyme S subunit